ncbi:hypothetical protein FHQ08_12710, partial [Lactobacillus sp. CC-MHH1034]|nr:hypothetical protein [Agrilactobacillus fermenti]
KPKVLTVDGEKTTYDKVVYEETADVIEIRTKVSDANKAAELLGKRYSLWTDKLDIQSSDINIVIGGDGDDNDTDSET